MNKFDKAICEGYDKYLTNNPDDMVSIPRELAERILEIVKQSSAKFTHEKEPEIYKDIIRSYFKLSDALQNVHKSEEESIKISGAGGEGNDTTYYVDEPVERLANKPGNKLGAFGMGSAAYKAKKAVEERDKLNRSAIDVYKRNTANIANQLNKAK